MSRTAAPLGDVTIPIRCGNFGNGRFRSGATDSARLKNLNIDLVLSARFENCDGAEDLHLCAIGERLSRRLHGVSPDHAGDLCPLIFEREILMTARVQFVV